MLSDRVARGDRAKAALAEFLEPAFKQVEHDYAEKLIAAATSTDPRAREVIERLSHGIKAVRVVRGLIEAHVLDGAIAEKEMRSDAKLARMSEFQRATVGV